MFTGMTIIIFLLKYLIWLYLGNMKRDEKKVERNINMKNQKDS